MTDLPRVTMIFAASVDGKITTADDAGPQFTSANDKSLLRRLRAESDAVILGAGTVRNDDPPFRLPDEMKRRRQRAGKWPTPIRAVVSGRGTVSPDARLFRHHESPALVFATLAIAPERERALSRVARVYKVGDENGVDPLVVLSILRDEHDVQSVLLEGGAELNSTFLKARCINEALLTVAPFLIGGRDVPTPIGGDGLNMDELFPLKLVGVRVVGDEAFLHYRSRGNPLVAPKSGG